MPSNDCVDEKQHLLRQLRHLTRQEDHVSERLEKLEDAVKQARERYYKILQLDPVQLLRKEYIQMLKKVDQEQQLTKFP